MNLRRELDRRISAAMRLAGAPEDAPAVVVPSARPQFGDYQANGVMGAAKKLQTNPRQLARKVLDAADLGDLAEKVEIAGPGFLNITLKGEFLAQRLAAAAADGRLGVAPPAEPQTVVVDYSSPNLAKEMHVGHLRSTIIGDALARTLEFVGHKVIRQNHVGDWGTQFGMLVAQLEDEIREQGERRLAGQEEGSAFVLSIPDMEKFYVKAKAKFDSDPAFADRARENVVKLQGGDAGIKNHWDFIVVESLRHAGEVLDRLGVSLTSEHVRGESAYNDDLPKVIEALDEKGLLSESEGARCVFLDGFTNKDGEPLPVIVQKTGGGYLYATTDLAAMRYRVGAMHANRILYVTDIRQALHFRQVFAVAKAADFVPEEVSLEHVGFGMMLGADGKPFKTRSGGTVKLMDLLDEAENRAFELVSERSPDAEEDRRREIARVVGIGAVKYADLSQNRTSDYVFTWDKLLSLDGNTAPYMQYAYARIQSIFRKGSLPFRKAGSEFGVLSSEQRQEGGSAPEPASHDREDLPAEGLAKAGAGLLIRQPAERALALKLCQFPEAVSTVAAECAPHVLCGYLYDLAGAFMGFYENCPVLQADSDALRAGRLELCHLTAETIRTGLGLLGIETVEQM